MTTQHHPDRNDPRPAPVPSGKAIENTGSSSEEKDPDLYDPVGMAGEKAGVVKQVEQQLKEDDPKPRTEGGAE